MSAHSTAAVGSSPGPTSSTAESGTFRPVSVVQAPVATAATVAVHLPCGTRIEVITNNLDAIRAVISDLQQADAALLEPQSIEPRHILPGGITGR